MVPLINGRKTRMPESYPVFEGFIHQIGFTNSSASVHSHKFRAAAFLAFGQFLYFLFSSNHKIYALNFLQRYKKYQYQKNKMHFFALIFLKLLCWLIIFSVFSDVLFSKKLYYEKSRYEKFRNKEIAL